MCRQGLVQALGKVTALRAKDSAEKNLAQQKARGSRPGPDRPKGRTPKTDVKATQTQKAQQDLALTREKLRNVLRREPLQQDGRSIDRSESVHLTNTCRRSCCTTPRISSRARTVLSIPWTHSYSSSGAAIPQTRSA